MDSRDEKEHIKARQNHPVSLLHHKLAGRIALEQKNYDAAIAELANQQNPDVLYLLGEAYQGKGDAAKAKNSFTKRRNSIHYHN